MIPLLANIMITESKSRDGLVILLFGGAMAQQGPIGRCPIVVGCGHYENQCSILLL